MIDLPQNSATFTLDDGRDGARDGGSDDGAWEKALGYHSSITILNTERAAPTNSTPASELKAQPPEGSSGSGAQFTHGSAANGCEWQGILPPPDPNYTKEVMEDRLALRSAHRDAQRKVMS